MVDVLSSEQRKLNMSRIRSKDTKPEMLIRCGLHALGLRYRLHDRSLPGRPDLVFSRYRTAVFVNGCFWHAHGCVLFKLPTTRLDYWKAKLAANVQRDRKAIQALHEARWRVLIIWECALRGRNRLELEELLNAASAFLRGNLASAELPRDLDVVRHLCEG